jgi:hypothetical protein
MLWTLFDWFERIPRWLRPAVGGAVVILALTAARVLLSLPAFLERPAAREDAIRLLVGAPMLGIAAGLAYTLLGAPLRRIPDIGPYLAGTVTAAAYFGAFLGFVVLTGEEADSGSWFAATVCTLVFGPTFGHHFLRDDPVVLRPNVALQRTWPVKHHDVPPAGTPKRRGRRRAGRRRPRS